MSFGEGLLIAFATGGVCTFGTVMALRTDIQWLKATTRRAHERIDNLQQAMQFRG